MKKKTVNQKVAPPVTEEKKVEQPVLPPVIPSNSEPNYLDDEQIDFNSDVFDEGDIASALELGFIAQALERHKEKVAPEKHPDFDGTHCVDCDIEIPQLRLTMGKVRCVDCQEILEKKNKMRGK